MVLLLSLIYIRYFYLPIRVGPGDHTSIIHRYGAQELFYLLCSKPVMILNSSCCGSLPTEKWLYCLLIVVCSHAGVHLFNLAPEWSTDCLFRIIVLHSRMKKLAQLCLYPVQVGTSLRIHRSYFLFHSGIFLSRTLKMEIWNIGN